MGKTIEDLIDEEGFETNLEEIAELEISDEEVRSMQEAEIYGEQKVRKALALNKMIHQKYREAQNAMWEWIRMAKWMNDRKYYQCLGFSRFEDWVNSQGVSKGTVDNWLKVLETYIIRHRISEKEIANYDIAKLKIILPFAKLKEVQADQVREFIDSITSMRESDLRFMVKEETSKINSNITEKD